MLNSFQYLQGHRLSLSIFEIPKQVRNDVIFLQKMALSTPLAPHSWGAVVAGLALLSYKDRPHPTTGTFLGLFSGSLILLLPKVLHGL